MNKETLQLSPKRKLSIIDILIVIFAILALCIFSILATRVFQNVFLTPSQTSIYTESIKDLSSYNSAISNISSSIVLSNIWVTEENYLLYNVHINIKNNTQWPIQIAKIILGDIPYFYNRTNQKLELPYDYSYFFCQLGGRPDITVNSELPQVPGYDLEDYHFYIRGQDAHSTAEYECGVYGQQAPSTNIKICVVFYPMSEYSFETFNYVYRDHYYTVDPEWEKAFDEFRLVTKCNR